MGLGPPHAMRAPKLPGACHRVFTGVLYVAECEPTLAAATHFPAAAQCSDTPAPARGVASAASPHAHIGGRSPTGQWQQTAACIAAPGTHMRARPRARARGHRQVCKGSINPQKIGAQNGRRWGFCGAAGQQQRDRQWGLRKSRRRRRPGPAHAANWPGRVRAL